MSGFVNVRASGSWQEHERMEVDRDGESTSLNVMASLADDGDEATDYSSGDGDDDDDGDEYIDVDEEEERIQAENKGDKTDDALFQRLAGFVSAAVPEGGQEGVASTSFQQEIAAFDEQELPQVSKRDTRRRLRRPHRPTYDVQQLLGRANMAYISQSHEEAVGLFLEVIRHDPHVQAAWTSLASCYEEMGQHTLSRQMRFGSAHIEEDFSLWRELANEFRADGNNIQALYCLRKALKLEPASIDVLWHLVEIYKDNGQKLKAVNAFRKIHRTDPAFLHDFTLLMDMEPLIMETNQFSFGAMAFGEAFLYHFATFNSPDDQRSGELNTMQIEHVVTYVDFLIQTSEFESALGVIHRGQRWLQGRKSEKNWDAVDDDSEYYPPEDEEDGGLSGGGYELDTQLRHRLALVRLRLGDDSEAMIHVNMIMDLDPYLHGQLFSELGKALMKRHLWQDALDFWAILQERENMDDEPEMIFNLGVCQHNLKRHAEAVDSFKYVISMDPKNTEARLQLAAVYEDMGNKAEALETVSTLLQVIRLGLNDGRKSDGGQTQSKGERTATAKLNKRILEAQAQETMQSLWLEVQEAELAIQAGESGSLDRFINAAGTMIETFRLAKSNFTKNRGITRVYKKTKFLKMGDVASQAKAMQDRLERTLGFEDETPLDHSGKDYTVIRQTDFYGVGNEDWLALTIKYCCVLMIKEEEEFALDILEHTVWAGLFNNRRCEIALRLTTIACAMRLRYYDKIIENCKRLSQMHQFRPEPILLMLAALGGGSKQQVGWQAVAFQKFLHRELRIFDEAAMGVKLRFNPRLVRWAQIFTTGQSRLLGHTIDEDVDDYIPIAARQPSRSRRESIEAIGGDEGDDDEAEEGLDQDSRADERDCPKPTKFSPIFNALYGQNLLTAKSYQTALYYLFRAYEANEYDPYLCFLIAQAYFGRSMNRQSDNRNHQIVQGMAFMKRYRDLSPSNDITQEEVEYNFGRSFHTLGIHHLAVIHYERVLESVRIRMNADPENAQEVRENSIAWEAAHNLVLIYAASGSLDLVRARSSEWLALR